MAVIVLIEDNPKHARLIGKILGQYGHVVLHAATAIEGLNMVVVSNPQMVLLDFDLPDLDGKALANRLRRIPALRSVPIVAVSANDSAGIQKLAISFGCDGYILKPIDVRSFPQEIEKYLAAAEQLQKRRTAAHERLKT